MKSLLNAIQTINRAELNKDLILSCIQENEKYTIYVHSFSGKLKRKNVFYSQVETFAFLFGFMQAINTNERI